MNLFDTYYLVEWPDYQAFMDLEDFKENSYFGEDNVYFIKKQWIDDMK